MRICNFGDRITIDKKLRRIRKGREKVWVDQNIEPVEVIVIGIRNLSDGTNDYMGGEGVVYEAKTRFKALKVVQSMSKNPFFVRYNLDEN